MVKKCIKFHHIVKGHCLTEG